MFFRNRRGITLMTTVMLIIFTSITVFGVTHFIIQRFLQIQTTMFRLQALYLAQAGVQDALYDFRVHSHAGIGSFSLGRTDVDANSYFVSGGDDAGFVMVDASQVIIGGRKNEELYNLTVQNANNTRPVTIDRMIVQWDDASRRLKSVNIAGTKVWAGNGVMPADLDIRDFTLDAVPTLYAIDSMEFDKDISSISFVDVEFIMLDGTSRNVRVFPAHNDRSFLISVTGKTVTPSHYRSVQAQYDILTSKIIDYREIANEIIP